MGRCYRIKPPNNAGKIFLADSGFGNIATDAPSGYVSRTEQPNRGIWDTVKGAWNSVAKAATAWHFEGRDRRNVNLPASVEFARVQGSDWIKMKQSMNEYHDDGIGDPETKFIHPDGREVIYSGDTGRIVTNPRLKGTYNYINPANTPEQWYNIPGWGKFALRGTGHFFADMLPYYIGGNVRGPDN